MKIYIERAKKDYFYFACCERPGATLFLGFIQITDQAEPVLDLFRGAPQLLEAVDSAILHWKKKVDDKTPMTTEEIALFGQLLAAARQCRVLRTKGENP